MTRTLTALALTIGLAFAAQQAAAQEAPVDLHPTRDSGLGKQGVAPLTPRSPDANLAPVTRDRRGAPGVLTSRKLRRMPEGFPVSIVAIDDREIDGEIKRLLTEALQETGRIVTDDAPLELAFRSQIVRSVIVERPPSLGQVTSSTGQTVGNQGQSTGVEVQMNVWSSTRDSLFGGRNPSSGQKRDPRFYINATLRDLETGTVVWQADVVCEMVTTNESRIVRAMVGPLAASVGKTVTQEPFDIN